MSRKLNIYSRDFTRNPAGAINTDGHKGALTPPDTVRKTNKRQETGLEFYSGGGIYSKHLLVSLLPINVNIGQMLDISVPLVAFIVVHEELVADNSQRSNHDHELLEVHFAVLVFIQVPHDVVDHHLIPVGLEKKGGLQEVQPPLLS